MRRFSIFGALTLASYVSAQNVTYCPGSNVCYAVNIPASTASTGSGDIYFQITGPSSMSWIGLGQGSSMTGANIFMVYADAAGTNVTLSPRLGTGEVQPKSDTTAQVTLLGGSGITGGVMTANVRCSNCDSWSGGSMSFTDSSSDWIWAYLSGNAISSDSASANVGQHSKYGTTSINLQDAAGGSSSNPFLTTTATSSTSGNSTSSSSSSSSSSQTKADNILMAHAILAPIAFALLFPMGAMGIRALSFPGLLVLHAGWMIVTLSTAIVAMGLGIWYAVRINYMNTSHAIIGIVAVVSLFIQPTSGFLHHRLFKRYGRPNFATYPHIWWGRSFVTLGIINGGLGLRLTGRARKYVIVYGVLAGIIWGLWMTVVLVSFLKGRGNRQADMGEELVGMRSGPDNGIRKPGLGPRYSESVNERNIQDSPLANSFSERRIERN